MISINGDTRPFRQWVRVNDAGVVTSTHYFEASIDVPTDGEGHLYLEVTDEPPQDFNAMTFAPAVVAAQKALRAQGVDVLAVADLPGVTRG